MDFVLKYLLKYVWYSLKDTHKHEYDFCVSFNEIRYIYVRLTWISTMTDIYWNIKIK